MCFKVIKNNKIDDLIKGLKYKISRGMNKLVTVI